MSRSDTPRGLRNNNPGNLRKNSAFTWLGEIGADNAGFVVFDTPENGLRALARLLLNYNRLYGVNTIAGILDRYAPASENNTEAYIAHAVDKLGISEYAPLAVDDYPKLMAVIIQHENGQNPFSMAQIEQGVSAAYA